LTSILYVDINEKKDRSFQFYECSLTDTKGTTTKGIKINGLCIVHNDWP